MKKILVRITEKDKKGKDLTLINLKEELVNFLYKDTVAYSTKADLLFFVLLFFLSIKVKNTTLLRKILDEVIPKLDELNNVFASKNKRLKVGEYHSLVKKAGLEELFKFDVFFVIAEAILNKTEIQEKYSGVLEQMPEVFSELDAIEKKYGRKLHTLIGEFVRSEIEDNRYDEYGRHHDLGKSVYRMVRMRLSRSLDINLQKYTSVTKVTSQSPIDLNFIQYIDVQIIFDLWDKYHVAEFIQALPESVMQELQKRFDLKLNFGDLIIAYFIWKMQKPSERKKKRTARDSFELIKKDSQNDKTLAALSETLTKSILGAGKRLEEEIKKLREQLVDLTKQDLPAQNREDIEKLQKRIASLENLEVKTTVIK